MISIARAVFGNAIDPRVDPRELRRARVGGVVALVYEIETREVTLRPSAYLCDLCVNEK